MFNKKATTKEFFDAGCAGHIAGFSVRPESRIMHIFRRLNKVAILSLIALFFILINSVVYMSAFEAHVVNVIAKIEPPQYMCDARSQGYWKNNEGCHQGEGTSAWTEEINNLSSQELLDYFGIISSEDICVALWTPDCPSGNTTAAKFCKAKAMVLADELNVVSGDLDPEALIADADDGSNAFDVLGFNYNTSVKTALLQMEGVLGNDSSSKEMLLYVAYTAERIYTFYEEENSDKPYCVTETIDLGKDHRQCKFDDSNIDNYILKADKGSDSNNKGHNNNKNDNTSTTTEEIILPGETGTTTEETITATSTDETTGTTTEEVTQNNNHKDNNKHGFDFGFGISDFLHSLNPNNFTFNKNDEDNSHNDYKYEELHNKTGTSTDGSINEDESTSTSTDEIIEESKSDTATSTEE